MLFIRNTKRFFNLSLVENKIREEINRQKRFNKFLFGGTLVIISGTGVVVCLKNPNCPIYDGILTALRKWVDPEVTHNFSICLAKYGFTPIDYSVDPPVLFNNIKHIKLFNPIGMAAGYDKNCEVPLEVLRLGFGFIEVGSVLPKPQPGNPKPRFFRLPHNKALINSFGFNSLGVDKAVENMKVARARQESDPLTKDSIIGISIGKNVNGDILNDTSYCISKIGVYADYIAVNVSSPNTPNLRENQRKEPLVKLLNTAKKTLEELDKDVNKGKLKYVNTTKCKPLLFFKISPDLSDQELNDVAEIALKYNVDGLILTNSTVSRPEYLKEELDKVGNPKGGLSGKPLFDSSKRIVFEMYKLTKGKVPIIACGGISTPQDALEMIEAGATICQIFTSLVYSGPKLPGLMKKNLANLLIKKGYKNISEAVGAAHKKN